MSMKGRDNMPVQNVNLPSTFVASGTPTTNFSAATVMYVGVVPGLGTCNGLLQIPTLPACTPLVSAVLQLGVYTKTGASPSTVNIQKVTAPSPLDTTTVTYSTPGLTISPTIEATKSIATADIGTNVQIDITPLISSWYTTPFPGIALTCTDGTYVLFDSSASANPPLLILTCGDGNDVTIVGHYVDTASETVVAPVLGPGGVDATSTPRDISQRTNVSFFFTNTGAFTASVGIEESVDGTIYVRHPQTNLPIGVTGVLSPGYYAKYARLYYHSQDLTNPTSMLISYIAQT